MSNETPDDGQLLSEFVATGHEAPFETLVARHGSLVYGVCCRVLGEAHDAEDAAQAVFLTLANKARSLRGYVSVAGWLHHVAWNISVRARDAAAARKNRERVAGEAAPMIPTAGSADDKDWELVKPLLDEELQALPEKYRVPLILHHVEGRTQEEIAALLGCTYGTLSGRLNRARELLRERLVRRGVTFSPALLFLLIPKYAPVAFPAALAASTVRAASLLAAGHAAVPGAFSAQAHALSQGAMRTMFVTKLKIAGGIAATFLILVSLAGVAMYSSHAAENAPAPAPVNVAAAPAPVAPKVPPRPTPKDDQPAPAAATAPFAQAIANLGSDDVQTRIAAMDELRKAGAKAQSALEAATKQDGAAKNRAAELLGVLKTAPVVEQLVAQAKKLKTFEVDLTTTMIMGGIPLVSKGHVKGVPAKNKYISDASMNFGPMDMTTHIICDGAIIWMELTTPAPGNGTQKMVMKQPLDDPGARNQLDGVDFSTYSDQYDFTSTRVEKRDNSDVYVLEGAVREDYREKLKHELDDAGAWANQGAQQINAQQSCVVVVGKDDGLVRKSEVRDDKGVVTNTTEFSGFKLGTALEDSAFIYCPPPNVTVMDTAELKKNLKAKAPPAAPKSTEKKDF